MTATVTSLRERPVPEIVMIPLTQLIGDDNIRDSLGTKESLQELAESIRKHGILEPLIVSWIEPPEGFKGEPGYRIAAGHRRHTAAGMAKLEFAPCIVREMDETERLQVMLIENLKRRDLDPIEEAKAFARAITLGMTKKDLAKEIATPESTVTDRIALLELPNSALEEIRKGKLTLDEAKQLLRLRKLKTYTKEVESLLKKGGRFHSYTIDSIISRYERKDKADALAEEAKSKGYTVIRATSTYSNPKGAIFLSKLAIEGKDATKHARQKCHAIVIVNDGYSTPTTRPACTDPGRHSATGDSTIKVPEKQVDRALDRGESVPGMSDEEVIARKERREERARRQSAFLLEVIKATPKAEKVAGIISFVAERTDPSDPHILLFADEMGMTPSMNWPDQRTAIRQYVTKSASNQITVAYAEAFMHKLPGRHDEEGRLMWLVDHGYEPDEEEAPIVAKLLEEKTKLASRLTSVPAEILEQLDAMRAEIIAFYDDTDGEAWDDDIANALENNEGEALIESLKAILETTRHQLDADKELEAEEAAEASESTRDVVDVGTENAALADVDEEGGDDEKGGAVGE